MPPRRSLATHIAALSLAPGRAADFNGDRFVDFFDDLDFTTAFEAGC